MVSLLVVRCCGGRKYILTRLIAVEVRFLVRHFLVRCDLVGDHEIVSGVDGGCHVVYFGSGFHCSAGDYEVGFVVVKFLLQIVRSCCIILVLFHNGKWSWLLCISAIVR